MRNTEKLAALSLGLAACAPDVDLREATGLDQESKELVYNYRYQAIVACSNIPLVDGTGTPIEAIKARKEAEQVLSEKGCEPELTWDCWFDKSKGNGLISDNSITAPFETEVGGSWLSEDCSHISTGDLIAGSIQPLTATLTQVGFDAYAAVHDFFATDEQEETKETKSE